MAAKAKLTIVLKADETVVAEVDDPILWQRVLGIINQGGTAGKVSKPDADPLALEEDDETVSLGGQDTFLTNFAKKLGVPTDIIVGALSPSKEPPYLHLNAHNWEAFKKASPKRGTGAINPTGLAGTALVLWFREAKLEVPATQALALAVLDTIGIKDPNPSRGIKNTKWLQGRSGGTIIVNPAEISKAQEVVRAFCLKKAPGTDA
jgi:hypothetical protein